MTLNSLLRENTCCISLLFSVPAGLLFTHLTMDSVSWQLLVDCIKNLCRDFCQDLEETTAAELCLQVPGYRFLLKLRHGLAKHNCCKDLPDQ